MLQQSPPDLMANPAFKDFIEAFAQLKQTNSLDEARQKCADYFLANSFRQPIHRVEDLTVEGLDQNAVPIRLYIPESTQALPVVVYFHRGGWVFGSIEEADPICRKMAHTWECIVVSVDYRLAPENPFPKPLEDAYAATRWVSEHISSYGGNPERLVVCGESAGGNLAAAVAIMARDNKGPSIASQLLIYPIITSSVPNEPYDTSVDRYFLTKDSMKFFWSVYTPTAESSQNPYASVDLNEDFSGLPPALIVTGEYDPLQQEGEKYETLLRRAGNETLSKNFPQVIHGFLDLPIYDDSQKNAWIKEIGQLLQRLFTRMS